jgi:tetratricopeptide (TPR) repeat protein
MRSNATAMTETRPGILGPHEIGELVALVNQERPREAEQKALGLLQDFAHVGMLWKILSVALLRQGKDALPALQRTAQLLPQDAEACGNLGEALADQRRWAEALESWRRALALEPRDFGACLGAADALRTLGRATESIDFYQRALTVDPVSLAAHNNLGNAFLALRRHDEAVACYRRAAAIKPDDAQVHCNLSNAFRQQGALAEALACCRRALELDGSLGAAHSSLGLILAAQGRREEAAACYRQALILDPHDAEALNNLGHVLRDLGQRREAASLYGRAVALAPERAENHCNLGNALYDLMQTEAAVDCYRRALELAPNHVPAHLSLAAALRLKRRTAEAEQSCRAALALDPVNVEALSFLGELLADQGRFAAAEALFERALEINPDYPFAYCGIAMHRKMSPTDTQWLEGALALLRLRLPLRQEMSVRYALGKYFDDVGRYAEAFDQYLKANELSRRQDAPYDRAKLRQRVDAVIARCDAAFMQQPLRGASGSLLPVFIVGMPRSGTSLVEQILASHRAVIGAGELKFWDAAFRDVLRADAERADADRVDAERADADRVDAAGMAQAYLGRLPPRGAGVERVVDKMPANFLYVGLIHAIFPKARIIHMRRDPIDTCLSIYFQNFHGMGAYANDLANLAHYYGEYQRVTDHWRAMLPAASLLEVPYESLIADQETWTRRMLDFIGLPWDPACLEFHNTDRVVITASKWQVRQKMHAASAGRWRHYEPWLEPLLRALQSAGVRG